MVLITIEYLWWKTGASIQNAKSIHLKICILDAE